MRSGHPWVFGDSVREQNREGRMGELAVVYDRRDQFLALGLFDPDSPLRVRVLCAGKAEPVDRAFWSARLARSLERRQGLFDDQTTGFRWIHGESDGWPGLVLDRYDRTLVLKLYTAAWLPWVPEILPLITERLQPERILLRLSRGIQERVAEQFQRADGQVLWGHPVAGPVVFRETGLQFEADVVRGQKTGFFLDQRENRRRVEGLAHGRRVLNAFSFSGGFSLYAARGGARSVTDVDISPHALAAAGRNFALNQGLETVRCCHRESVQADVFEWLGEPGAAPRAKPSPGSRSRAPRPNRSSAAGQNLERTFDLVILDPPSLAKRESERSGAIAAYGKLASLGIRRLAQAAILVACSCSAHVSADEFFGAVRAAARRSGRGFTEIGTTEQPSDHPAAFAEGHYLKAIYLEF